MNGWKTILVGDLAYFQALEHIKEGISLEGAGGKKLTVPPGFDGFPFPNKQF